MKKIITFITILFFTTISYSQSAYYRSILNIVATNDDKWSLNIGANYDFNIVHFHLICNLAERYFVFGTYNFDNSVYKYYPLDVLPSGNQEKRIREKKNFGFRFGGGVQKLGKIGCFDHLELLAGTEMQYVNTTEYFPSNSTDKDYLSSDYYKIFIQFNMISCRNHINFGPTINFSFLQFTKFNYNSSEFGFKGKSTFFIDPTFIFDIKLLKKRNLLLCSQIGLSAALYSIVSESSTYNNGIIITQILKQYFFQPILALGIQYRFKIL